MKVIGVEALPLAIGVKYSWIWYLLEIKNISDCAECEILESASLTGLEKLVEKTGPSWSSSFQLSAAPTSLPLFY